MSPNRRNFLLGSLGLTLGLTLGAFSRPPETANSQEEPKFVRLTDLIETPRYYPRALKTSGFIEYVNSLQKEIPAYSEKPPLQLSTFLTGYRLHTENTPDTPHFPVLLLEVWRLSPVPYIDYSSSNLANLSKRGCCHRL